MAQYNVTYKLDGGCWFARVPALQACFTQGDTLEEAKSNIREVLALMVNEEAASAVLIDEIVLPRQVSAAIRSLSDHGIHAADMEILLRSAPAEA